MNIGLVVIFAVGLSLIAAVLILGHRYGKIRKRAGGPEHILFGPGMTKAFGSGVASDITRHPIIGYVLTVLVTGLFFSMKFYIAGVACAIATASFFLIGRLYPISKEAREELVGLQSLNDWRAMLSKDSSLKIRGVRPGWTSWVLVGLIFGVLAAVYLEFYLSAILPE